MLIRAYCFLVFSTHCQILKILSHPQILSCLPKMSVDKVSRYRHITKSPLNLWITHSTRQRVHLFLVIKTKIAVAQRLYCNFVILVGGCIININVTTTFITSRNQKLRGHLRKQKTLPTKIWEWGPLLPQL